MSKELLAENASLHDQLKSLLDQSRHNQQNMRRHLMFDLNNKKDRILCPFSLRDTP